MYELCRKDAQYVTAQRAKFVLDVKKDPKKKLPVIFFSVMDRVDQMLADNIPLRTAEWTNEEVMKINELIPQAITLKPIIYLINIDKRSFIRKANKWFGPINEWVQNHGKGTIIPLSVEWEQELWHLRDDSAAKAAFLENAGGSLKSVLPRIIKVGYKELNLSYYFTAGEKEVRCWTIPAGALAPEAAGAIHTDFERGFIKAEVGHEPFLHYVLSSTLLIPPRPALGISSTH